MPHATPYTPPTVTARAPPSKVVCVLGYRRECRIYGSLDPGAGQASHANVSDPCFFKVLNSGPRADLESIMADLVEPIRAQPHRLEAHAPLPQLSQSKNLVAENNWSVRPMPNQIVWMDSRNHPRFSQRRPRTNNFLPLPRGATLRFHGNFVPRRRNEGCDFDFVTHQGRGKGFDIIRRALCRCNRGSPLYCRRWPSPNSPVPSVPS